MKSIDQLILHQATRKSVESTIKRQPHALLIIGEEGSGKGSVARVIALQFTGAMASIHTFGGQSDSPTTGIDEVRMLSSKSKHKRHGDSQIAWIIEDVERLSNEGQSALLKILEEPPSQTYFILTSSQETKVLSTIRSRCVRLQILQPLSNDVKQLAEKNDEMTDQTIEMLLLLSQSYAGRFQTYLDEIRATGKVKDLEMMQEIKRHLATSNFELIAWFSSLPKELLPEAIEKLTLLCRLGLRSAAMKQNEKQIKIWQNRLREALELGAAITQNGHAKVHIASRLFGY